MANRWAEAAKHRVKEALNLNPKVDLKPSLKQEQSSDSNLGYLGGSGKRHQPYLDFDNPLVKKKGLKIFDEMLKNDAQVSNTFNLKRYMRLVTGYDIRPFEEGDPESEEIAKFVKWTLNEYLSGSVSSFLLKMWDAMRLGYKVAEIIYNPIETGPYKGMIGISKLKVRKSNNYRFDTDDHGNIRPNGLIEGIECSGGGTGIKNLNIDKFVIFTWGALDDDGVSLYGNSEFAGIYRYYAANDFIHIKWLRRLERISEPVPIATIDPTYPMKSSDREALAQDLADLNHKVSYVPPPGVKVSAFDVGFGDVSGGKTSESGFTECLNWNNSMISKGLLVGSLVQQEGKASGSYALGQVQFDVLVHCLEHLGRVTCDEIMGEQVIRRLVDLNYTTWKYPRFYMPSLIQDDPEPRAKVIKICVESGVINPEEPWVRDYLNIPSNLSHMNTKKEPVPKPGLESTGKASKEEDVLKNTKDSVGDAKKQMLEKNKEVSAVNVGGLKRGIRNYLIETFVEDLNQKAFNSKIQEQNPQWVEIMKLLRDGGSDVMPLPNVAGPLFVFEQVGKIAESYAEKIAGIYKYQIEDDSRKIWKRNSFQKLDTNKKEEAIEMMAENSIKKSGIQTMIRDAAGVFRSKLYPDYRDIEEVKMAMLTPSTMNKELVSSEGQN
jgi:phage gp29-like protein